MTQTVTFDDAWEMIHKTNRAVREMVAENRARQVETDRQFKETDRKIKEVSAQIGNLGGRWGEFVEGLVAPGWVR